MIKRQTEKMSATQYARAVVMRVLHHLRDNWPTEPFDDRDEAEDMTEKELEKVSKKIGDIVHRIGRRYGGDWHDNN
jgi:hypothetical protein